LNWNPFIVWNVLNIIFIVFFISHVHNELYIALEKVFRLTVKQLFKVGKILLNFCNEFWLVNPSFRLDRQSLDFVIFQLEQARLSDALLDGLVIVLPKLSAKHLSSQ
jgi:hypothetical protein